MSGFRFQKKKKERKERKGNKWNDCVGSVHLAMQVHQTPAASEDEAAFVMSLSVCVFRLASLFVPGVQSCKEVK